jgi:hypothetical protein
MEEGLPCETQVLLGAIEGILEGVCTPTPPEVVGTSDDLWGNSVLLGEAVAGNSERLEGAVVLKFEALGIELLAPLFK